MKVITKRGNSVEIDDLSTLTPEEIQSRIKCYEQKYGGSLEQWERTKLGGGETGEEMMDWLEWSALVEEREGRNVERSRRSPV